MASELGDVEKAPGKRAGLGRARKQADDESAGTNSTAANSAAAKSADPKAAGANRTGRNLPGASLAGRNLADRGLAGRNPPGKSLPGKKRTGGKPPRTRLTGRAGILALALCATMVSVAYPLQQYFAQRSQLDAVNAQNAAVARQVTKLQVQLNDWNDPDFVMIQARAQLHYVLPGQIGFTVPQTGTGLEPIGIPSPTGQPWYDNLWSTVKAPPSPANPTPTPTPTPTHTISE